GPAPPDAEGCGTADASGEGLALAPGIALGFRTVGVRAVLGPAVNGSAAVSSRRTAMTVPAMAAGITVRRPSPRRRPSSTWPPGAIETAMYVVSGTAATIPRLPTIVRTISVAM